MKNKFKKAVCLLMAVMVLSVAVPVAAQAKETPGGTLNVMTYNVAGLPDINYLLHREGGVDVAAKMTAMGKLLNASGCDIIATQEDFNYNKNLRNELDAYKFKTPHMGGIPFADGMNVYSKYPIYNMKRIKWESASGVISGGADELTPKGILYCLVDLGNGVFLDFYDIHADAYGDEGSIIARKDNMRQLAELINSRKNDRPVIVVGDTNSSFFLEYSSFIYKNLVTQTGLKDAWVEFKHDGNYTVDPNEFDVPYWGNWDSVDRLLYKDGGGVDLEISSFEYKGFMDASGNNFSDHSAAIVGVSYTVENPVANTEKLTEPSQSLFQTLKYIVVGYFHALSLIIPSIKEAIEYVKSNG